ncbi:MAG: hypothetical protein ACKO2N_06485 [Tabrizicola sp.]
MLKSLSMAASVLSLSLVPAMAASVRGCDTWETSAAFVVFPVAENSAEYLGGSVRLITLDTAGEPACCSFHLMVLYLSPEGSYSECALISDQGTTGHYSIFVNRATVLKEDDSGVSLVIPTEGNVEGNVIPGEMKVSIDLAAGKVSAE